jgi:acetyl esterase/lipase
MTFFSCFRVNRRFMTGCGETERHMEGNMSAYTNPGLWSCGLVPAVLACAAMSAEPKPELLWPDGAPLLDANRPNTAPTITVHMPEAGKANGAAVVICPGGGYGSLMMSYEGHDVARWLNGYGFVGVVLKYRVSPYRHPVEMLDGQRGMRLARSKARQLNVDPNRIGIMGFSAGGHLASTVGTHFDTGNPKAADPIDRVSCRPDFMVLVYPVITMGPQSHGGSRANLLGRSPSADLIELLSNEKQVTKQTPPTFLAHSKVDQAVPVANSRMFHDALKAHGVPAEFFELPTGAHGLGCGKGAEWEAWQAKCLEWFKARGLVKD